MHAMTVSSSGRGVLSNFLEGVENCCVFKKMAVRCRWSAPEFVSCSDGRCPIEGENCMRWVAGYDYGGEVPGASTGGCSHGVDDICAVAWGSSPDFGACSLGRMR